MSRIKAFRAIRPSPLFASELICEDVPGDTCLKSKLEPGGKSGSAGGADQETFQEVRHILQNLLEKEILQEESEPAIYIYEVSRPGIRQTGIWAVTSLKDYTDGIIKTHEYTLPSVETRLRNYREQVGLEGSPILLTYRPDERIDRLIANTKKQEQASVTVHNGSTHRLWKITEAPAIHELLSAFEQIETAYLADGHHRLFAAVISAAGKGDGFINSLYIPSDQLRIREYDRVVIPDKAVDTNVLFEKISPFFQISPAAGNGLVRPGRRNQLGMYCNGRWYHLDVLPGESSPVADRPDAAVLQEKILEPVWDIKDPGSDRRLHYFGGDSATQALQEYLAGHPEALAFTLYPVTVGQLIAIADKGEIMPPKSTWIDPKAPYGLLMYRLHPSQRFPEG